jgi:hypothetical protein
MLEMVESIWCAGVVPTIDRATSAWRSSRRVRQHSLRCTATRRCCLAGRAQMSDIVDPLRRALHVRPSISPPVHGCTAVVRANVAYDVPVLAVVVWWYARRCRTMSTHRGARCSVDHRPRCPCTVAPPPCAPRLPTMYQYSLLSIRGARCSVDHRRRADVAPQCTDSLLFGGTRADVAPVEARDAVSTSDLATSVRRFRGTIEMHDYTYGCIKRNDLVITTRSISVRRRFAAAKRATDAARACAQTNHTSHFQASFGHALACKTRHQCDH